MEQNYNMKFLDWRLIAILCIPGFKRKSSQFIGFNGALCQLLLCGRLTGSYANYIMKNIILMINSKNFTQQKQFSSRVKSSVAC